MNKRLLVVPQRTSQTPTDAHVGLPTMLISRKTLIEISCVFTKDIADCKNLKLEWEFHGYHVRLDGPAFAHPGGEFQPGRNVKKGIIHTSRGCPNQCPFCWVPGREGKIRQYNVSEGNVIQDNNLLACDHSHVKTVFQMLRKQKDIRFLGGLDCDLVTDWVIDELQNLRIKEIWIAYDSPSENKIIHRTISRLRDAGFNRDHLRCYILAGYYHTDTPEQAEDRARWTWNQGAMPFMQVYDENPDLTKIWRRTARKWQRPAIMRTRMKNGI